MNRSIILILSLVVFIEMVGSVWSQQSLIETRRYSNFLDESNCDDASRGFVNMTSQCVRHKWQPITIPADNKPLATNTTVKGNNDRYCCYLLEHNCAFANQIRKKCQLKPKFEKVVEEQHKSDLDLCKGYGIESPEKHCKTLKTNIDKKCAIYLDEDSLICPGSASPILKNTAFGGMSATNRILYLWLFFFIKILF